MDINTILKDVFGFESEKVWEVNEKGVIEGFPVRFLIEKGRMNGLVFRGIGKSDEGLVYFYEFNDMEDREIRNIKVIEKNRKLILEFEYNEEKFRFVESY